jgi:SAM-dependent methyltransferase
MANRPDNQPTFVGEYDRAKNWQQLSWAHTEQTLFLADICKKRGSGRALDIGCGAGTDSIFLAKEEWDVTSLDFVAKAVEMTEKRAKEAGVSVTPVVADVLDWEPPHKYDLVLDHGLLHNMSPQNHSLYRQQLFKAMGDDADFVIVHWLKTHPSQPVTMVGPNRASREEIKDFFAPEMIERYFAVEEIEDLPWFVGAGLSQATLWFKRNNTICKPTELVAQIKSTLSKNSVDFDALISAAGDGLVEAELMPHMMARIAGPGRLGVSHTNLKRDETGSVLAAWAERAGENAHYIENLLRVFASKDHGKICTDMPNCEECEVVFCKRLRNK